MSVPRTGVYPGTFDPIHNGHLDIIRRATKVVDRLVIAVAVNIGKEPMFSLEERVLLVEHEAEALMAADRVNGCRLEVQAFERLLVDLARGVGANVIIRGLRAVSDFEYEFQMNQLNRTLAPEIETVYVMASPQVSFVSSSGVKEIAAFGGNVEELVPKAVAARLKEMFPNGRGGAPLSDQE